MMTLTTIAALPLLCPLALQEPAPSPQDDGAPATAPELVPGRIPAETSAEARALWQTLIDAMLGAQETRRPLSSFDLTFDVRSQRGGSHDLNGARFLYRAPNWVSSQLSKTNRLVRGPEGDFLIGREDVIELRGRDAREDRQQLDDTVNIAHNFTALTDPARLRLAKLELCSAPESIPEELRELAGALRWIEAESPDFRLYRTDSSVRRRRSDDESLFRATIGLDPKRALPTLVVIAEISGRRNDASSALLVRFDRYGELDGYQVPHYLATHPLDPKTFARTFRPRPELQLWLGKNGRLNPELEPALFSPPPQ